MRSAAAVPGKQLGHSTEVATPSCLAATLYAVLLTDEDAQPSGRGCRVSGWGLGVGGWGAAAIPGRLKGRQGGGRAKAQSTVLR
jgi:hypothetical protein